MRILFTISFLSLFFHLQAQTSIKGQLQDADGAAVEFANVALYNAVDSSLVKVETSDETGIFKMQGISPGTYYLSATFVGLNDLTQANINLNAGQQLDLGILKFSPLAIEIAQATVTAQRVMVETKPDRTIFNVQGTINSVGSDAISLLRKAPGVMVDNNDNITVLGRSGVLLYVDGKRLPLNGDDLTAYLQNLPAEQIDRFEIITNPGAKYEAEGNAGIIDIRLKKDKNLGANGSVNGTFSQGKFARYNLGSSGNYRNKTMNIFGNAGFGQNNSFHNMDFDSEQNNLKLIETVRDTFERDNYNIRLGTDFFLSDQHTLGLMVTAGENTNYRITRDEIVISPLASPSEVDSILVANNTADYTRVQQTFNINYRFDNRKGKSLNLDLDYGNYENETKRFQPNRYFDSSKEILLTEVIDKYDTPTDIDIYTIKVDYEDQLAGGVVGFGSKLSRVVSDNAFRVFDVIDREDILNLRNSNEFRYEENVYAGYVSYTRPINEKWNFSAGLRAEQTDATGDLTVFVDSLQEPPVELNYLSWFPNAGLTWQVAPKHSLVLNYGRRINRPDYNVLNPFNNQLSELSFEKGNPELSPEIVNNVELGYTLAWRYNFKLAYSKTTDQITRLIEPDKDDDRANFIRWRNLDEKTVVSFNASAPVQVNKWWSAYFNGSASFINNQSNYGDGATVDLQAFTYSFFQQHTFTLPGGFQGEISGYYSGPGIWGGVFKYESNWSLDIGLQRKFLQDRLNVRLGASDLFYETGWDGCSFFDGLESCGGGRWDSRRVSVSLSYNFGNQNVKSRKRKTGMEDEAGRLGEGG